jgi:hypothetical protein
MADSSRVDASQERVSIPLPVWFAFCTSVGLIAGYMGEEVYSLRGVCIILLVGVVLLSICEVRRWLRLARKDGNYGLRSLLAMVVSLGGIGGAWFGFLFWLFALLVSWILGRVPGIAGNQLSRSILGFVLGGGLFFFVTLISRKGKPPGHPRREAIGNDCT